MNTSQIPEDAQVIPDEAVEAAGINRGAKQRSAPLQWGGPASPDGPSCLHQQEPAYQQGMALSSSHVCVTCGDPFTVTPAVPPGKLDQWTECLGWHCASYTPTRDPELLGGIIRKDSP